jgi:predicted transcriptional regulator
MTKTISARIPDDLEKVLSEYCMEYKTSITLVLIDALGRYLEKKLAEQKPVEKPRRKRSEKSWEEQEIEDAKFWEEQEVNEL